MKWFHWHPKSWYVDDIELVTALPFVGYFFKTTLHCWRCRAVRTTTYLDALLILRLAHMGLRDPSYQEKGLELARQIRDDEAASLI